MDATPGHLNNFVVSESRHARLKKPYTSNCYSNWTQTSYSKYFQDNGYNYSRTVRLLLTIMFNRCSNHMSIAALQQILSFGFYS